MILYKRVGIRGALLLAVGLACASGCAMQAKGPDGWGAIVIDLKAVDTAPDAEPTHTIERPWIGFGLANPPGIDPGNPPPTPSTLHMRLRAGPADEDDPAGEKLEMIEVTGADIGRPGTTQGVIQEGPIVIALDPPAASFTFTGTRIDWPDRKEAVVGGVVRITFNRGFVAAAKHADDQVTTQTLLRAALMGVSTAELRQYNQLELQPDMEEILRLFSAQVVPATIQAYYEAGYGFGVEELLQLRAAGVDVAHAVGFVEGDFRFDAAQLIALHDAEVTPGYAIGMKQAGFAEDVETLIRVKKAGVEPAYAAAMRELGVATGDAELIALHAKGITPESVETFQKAEYDLTAQQLITLHDAGVSAQDALYMREAGYDFSLEDLLKLARWKVPTSYTLSLMSDDFSPMSADQIVDLRLRRVTPEMVRLLRQQRVAEGEPQRDDAVGKATPPPTVVQPQLAPLTPEPVGGAQ